ncbi:hypothetical protein Trydic_g8724 [Trypoxylus dichotomus]
MMKSKLVNKTLIAVIEKIKHHLYYPVYLTIWKKLGSQYVVGSRAGPWWVHRNWPAKFSGAKRFKRSIRTTTTVDCPIKGDVAEKRADYCNSRKS